MGLILVRISAIPLIMSVMVIYILLKSRRKMKFAVFASVISIMLMFFFVAPDAIEFFGGNRPSISGLFDVKLKLEGAKRLSSGDSLNLLFSPRNYIEVVLFAPIRTMMFLVFPFPRVWFYGGVTNINYNTLSLWLILLFSPALICATIEKVCRRQEIYRFIVVPFWLLLTLIPLGEFILHDRYRLMVMPFWLATILIGFCYGNINRYVVPSFAIIIMGINLFYLLKFFV
jgi:hypothetical protein